MAIDPIRVLPKFAPVPYGGGQDMRMGERMMLEVIQNELMTQRQKMNDAVASEAQFTQMLEKNSLKSFGLNPSIPYQRKAMEKMKAITEEASLKVQEAGVDTFKKQQAMREYQTRVSTDPDILGAIEDAATISEYAKHVSSLGDKANAHMIASTNAKIFDLNRKEALTFDKLNIGSHSLDMYTYGEKMLDRRQGAYEFIERDDLGNVVSEKKVNSLVLLDPKTGDALETEDESKARHVDYLKSLLKKDPAYSGAYNDAEIEETAKNVVDDRFEKNRGMTYASLKSTPQSRTGKSDAEKQIGRLRTGLKAKTPGYGLIQFDIDDDGIVYNTLGEQIGRAEDIWDDLSDADKQEFRRAGVDYDIYKVEGSNYKISGGTGLLMEGGETRSSIKRTKSMASEDAAYITENGIAPSAQVVTENGVTFVETNDPQVLQDKLKLNLKYKPDLFGKDGGGYVVTDSGGKEYIESKDGKGIFSTAGGSSVGSEKRFRVRLSEINKVPAGTTGMNFAPTGDLDQDTRMFIGAGESGADAYNAVNPSDNDWVSVGFYQFNTKENQKAIYEAGGKGKEWDALAAEIPKLSVDDRKAKIKALYNAMTPDQQKAFIAKQEDIASKEYYAPLEKQFDADGVKIPDQLKPLLRDMAIQHSGGMLYDNKKQLYDKIRDMIKSKPNPSNAEMKKMAQLISALRIDYVESMKGVPRAVKDSIIKNRVPNAYAMTIKIIDSGSYVKSATTNNPAVPAPPAAPSKTPSPVPGTATKPNVNKDSTGSFKMKKGG